MNDENKMDKYIHIRCDEDLSRILEELKKTQHFSNKSELIRKLIFDEAEKRGIK